MFRGPNAHEPGVYDSTCVAIWEIAQHPQRNEVQMSSKTEPGKEKRKRIRQRKRATKMAAMNEQMTVMACMYGLLLQAAISAKR